MPLKSHIEEAYRNHATLFLYYGMRILVALAAILFAIRGDWSLFFGTIFVVVLMSIPSFVKSRYRIYLPFAIDLAMVTFIFLSLFLGGIADLYKSIPIWDKLLHFQSGLLFSGTGFVVIYYLSESEQSPIELTPGFITLFAIVFSLAIGTLWEIVEFTGDAIFHSHWQIDNTDTMGDLIADGIGAVVFSIGAYFWMYRHKRLPFTPLFIKIMREAKKAARKTLSESGR